MERVRGSRLFLVTLLVGALVLLAVVFRPFAEALLLAAVLAAALRPLYRFINRKFRQRKTLAACNRTSFTATCLAGTTGTARPTSSKATT